MLEWQNRSRCTSLSKEPKKIHSLRASRCFARGQQNEEARNMLSFRECTLAELEKTFHLIQIEQLPALQKWLQGNADMSDFERESLLMFQDRLHTSGYDWNETELAYNFIGPVLALVNYAAERNCNFFAERPFGGSVDGIEMAGKPDGMVASGFRVPEKPFFCFQEYKKQKDPEGDPAGQALAAMLVAQEVNERQHPLYGAYIQGRDWCFMALQGKEYAMSEPFVATRDDVFEIYRILKVLKQIILTILHTP